MKDYLAKHPILKVLNGEELDTFITICKFEKYPKNTVIFCEEQPSSQFYILQKGKVKLDFGSEKFLEVNQGEIFGDWAMFNDTVRLATSTTLMDTACISVNYDLLKNSEKFPAEIALKVVLALTKPIIGSLQTPSQTASKILIAKGENQQVEFKASLRMNKHTLKKDDKMELASLKTVAGFLNSQGGVLFIGVADDGTIDGLAIDKFENTDKLLLHFGHLVNAKLGKIAASYIRVQPLTIEHKLVLRVDCSASPVPIFLEGKNQQYFFVRQSAQTLSFNLKEAVNYIQSHF